ncbi:MAG: cytochrome c3 family protein [Nitrospirae bacterium]|nr:cytochrome c3 family protein [Nitrospirota bacterium]
MNRYTVKIPWLLVCTVLASLGLLAVLSMSPARVEGVNMPGTIVIKYIENRFGPVTFNHTMHTSLAESCGICHHQHNDKIRSGCKDCHSLNADQFKASVKNGFLPCSGCHTDYSPEMPEMPGLKVAFHKKCFQCHVGIGELGSSPGGCVKTCHTMK